MERTMGIIVTRIVALSVLAMTVAVAGGVRAQEVAETQEPAAPEPVVVRMRFDRFIPDSITVPAGTTLVWVNEEDDPTNSHNVIAESGAFESPYIYPGESWSFTFVTPGEYRYYCDLHEGMYGTVIVE